LQPARAVATAAVRSRARIAVMDESFIAAILLYQG
jgi:hypothetical protein